MHVHKPVVRSHFPIEEHSVRPTCATSFDDGMPNQGTPRGHDSCEQSAPICPSQHSHRKFELQFPWPLHNSDSHLHTVPTSPQARQRAPAPRTTPHRSQASFFHFLRSLSFSFSSCTQRRRKKEKERERERRKGGRVKQRVYALYEQLAALPSLLASLLLFLLITFLTEDEYTSQTNKRTNVNSMKNLKSALKSSLKVFSLRKK